MRQIVSHLLQNCCLYEEITCKIVVNIHAPVLYPWVFFSLVLVEQEAERAVQQQAWDSLDKRSTETRNGLIPWFLTFKPRHSTD